MKHKFTIYDLRFTIWKKSANAAAAHRQSSIVNRQSQEGVALVITLILLSVTLIMAVAFLAISTRERNAVTTVTDTASARLAADAALASAEAQIVATIFTTNAAAYNFGLLVSTNYPPLVYTNAPDVFTNLFILPRAPVYLSNLVTRTVENRFYLDLNRNGVDDPNGLVTNVDNRNNIIFDSQGNSLVNQVGDPEWIGMLDHPDAPHGPNNRFVSRYAFIAVPVGNTLDINAIHNQAFNQTLLSSLDPLNDRYFRNEGVGSWEINLAAFLADLNTNEWDSTAAGAAAGGIYQYRQPSGFANSGAAFADAFALLTNRYTGNYNSLDSVQQLFGANGSFAFQNDNIDGYSDGFLQTGFQLPAPIVNPALPWSGADNTNQFFSMPSDLFDPTKTFSFSTNLLNAGESYFGGTINSTYDRYTFYRMLEELGSDSAPESGKINLNYSNAVVSIDANGYVNIAIVPNAETNFTPWAPTNFFMAAADRMLRLYTTNWFQESLSITNLNTTTTNSYLATYYGLIYTNQITLDQFGLITGLTNAPFYGMTNQMPAFGITNIPVLVNGQFAYSPAVNRLLQLAANIYDATTNHYYDNLQPPTPLPTVFRPIFNVVMQPNPFNVAVNVKNVYICGFSEVTSAYEADAPLSVPYDLRNPTVLANLVVPGIHSGASAMNVFGVPMIVGVKKGFPNFNEFYMENAFQLTRKLMVTRQSTNVTSPPPSPTSSFFNYYEMFNLNLSSQFGVECWNSYRSNYTRAIDIYVTNFLVMTLTNDENFSFTTNVIAGGALLIPSTSYWPGTYNSLSPNPQSFLTNFNTIPTNFAAVAVSRYVFNNNHPYLSTNLNVWYETTPTGFGQYPQPHWGMTMTNNLQVIMVDDQTRRLIDYVQLSGPNSIRDLTTEILSGYDTVNGGNNTGYNDLWDTNLVNGVPYGIANQYNISQGNGNPQWSQTLWGTEQTAYDAMNAFRVFTMGAKTFLLTYPGYLPNTTTIGAAETTNAIQMPYTPTATVVQDIVWQANDPLVHYMASDLVNPAAAGSAFTGSPFNWYNNYTYADNFAIRPGGGFQIVFNWPGNLGKLNQRYQPWGGNPSTGLGTNMLSIKDPLVTCSDDWNFPANKFPTVGWLGRVHRGTPWQTVFLKASDVLSYQNYFGTYGNNGPNLWVDWTGNINPFDVTNTAPKKDWLLFDLFSTAFNDNATRGTLSVNQPHLAAWSALFSGIVVPTTLTNTYTVIAPAGPAGVPLPAGPPPTNNSPLCLGYLVQNGTNGINDIRATFTNPDGVKGVFEHAGYILSVPALTVQSPFLAGLNPQTQISDEMYEWLPQQVMSLLRCPTAPRYVVYCYGQALKPAAANSLVTSGGATFGMCTNYQVVAESAVRAVLRVEGAGTPAPHVVVESFNPLPPD